MMSSLFSKNQRVLVIVLLVVLAIGAVVLPVTAQTSSDMTFTSIYDTVSPSVVAISVTLDPQSAGPMMSPQGERASGTGFVIDGDGHIVTNFHVVNKARDIEVYFYDGTLARAEVVGLDAGSDIAVIKVNDVASEHLHPVTFGDSDALRVGESVLAIGGPFGERWTLTSGIISALERTIRGMTDFSIGGVIQTDAAINPGNSGGPLLNMKGEVIGVNSQIVSSSGSNSGVGFAIPGNLTQRVAQNLIERGYMEYSYLGISGGNITLSLVEQFNLPNDTRGVVVGDVAPGGPAARAGLHSVGQSIQSDTGKTQLESVDIITAINGESLTSMEDLISYLAQNTQPGDEVTLDVLRDGSETLQVTVHLVPRP